jgi:hypothetical protein
MVNLDSSQRLEPFGMRAVRLGLVNVEQIEKALAVQKMLDKNGQRQLLGMVMVDLQMITTTQLLAVLHSYEIDPSVHKV